jgi:hypothetical protein
MDDTPGRERIRVQHGTANTFIEMHPNGDVVHKIYGDGYEIIAGRKNVQIKGTCNITIEGDCNMHVLGDKTEKIDGNYTLKVLGDMDVYSQGTNGLTLMSDNDMSIKSNSDYGGSISIQAADHLYLASDLLVDGAIDCDMLNASTRVNAGTGVFAGPLGFTSGEGGLSLGVPDPIAPIAVPGSINTIGSITSLTSVVSPIGTFGVSFAVLASDIFNSTRNNSHTHPAPHGTTGTTLLPFFIGGA